MPETLLYFAYGSNLSSARLSARVPAARFIATGHVPGRRLTFHKRGLDGSGKADAWPVDDPHSRVWGALYRVPVDALPGLDRAEGGYSRVEVKVVLADGRPTAAFLYQARATRLDPELRPFDWYKAYLMQGALEHGLPEDYVERIAAVAAVRDPDDERRRRNGQ